jgi:tryptophanyl-tRNA synthetase
MRPTGPLHIGHFFGALKNWRDLIEEYECFYMVADWHALMSEYQNPEVIRKYTIENVIDWIACGINPDKATIFIQSDVPQHAEIFLALSCVTPLGWLERNPTYKEQAQEMKDRDISNYAFLGYPVLQTVDIILYKAEVVPVGEDQLPHLELAREIVRRFNRIFGRDVFIEPYAKLTQTPRLPGLDGRKMSNSYGNFIALGDEPETVRQKIMTMFTDPKRPFKKDPGHPDECNAFNYQLLFNTPQRIQEIRQDCTSAKFGCVDCKNEIAEKIIEFLSPIQQRRGELLSSINIVKEILERGVERAKQEAQKTLMEVKEVIFR